MTNFKRPGYVAAYKRLRYTQKEKDSHPYGWVLKGLLYFLISFGPILFFQAFSIVLSQIYILTNK